MFSLGADGSFTAKNHDPTQERPPPELPTPVNFPHFQPPVRKSAPWQNHGDPPDLLRQFSRIRKPSDITVDQFLALNVSLAPETSIEELLSALPDVTPYIIPREWTDPVRHATPPVQAPALQHESPGRLLSNGRPYPGRQDFAARLTELVHDNHEAFSVLSRPPRDNGKRPPRLVHYRKFWEGLDNMAYYWDATSDEYIPPRAPAEAATLDDVRTDESVACKKAKTDPSCCHDTQAPSSATSSCCSQQHPAAAAAATPKSANTFPPGVPDGNISGDSRIPAGTYKGYRIGTGSGMPNSYRMDTVRAFVEPVAWCFGMTVSPHRRVPTLKMQRIRINLRVSAAVWGANSHWRKACLGCVRGPAVGIRIADYVESGAQEHQRQQHALLDVMSEIGCLLLVAQERARQGRVEVLPGEGKWWTSVPRWGGGKGGEVGEARGEESGDPTPSPGGMDEKQPGRSGGSRRSTRRKSAAKLWSHVRPGAGFWDPKVEYEAIGKSRNSTWDDVFCISSVNTHMSLLHLRVHTAYISWLETGEMPSPLPTDEDWCQPVLRRSRWYDFFEQADRLEATRGLWTLFGWLARPQEQSENHDPAKNSKHVDMDGM